jgi:hypothetical protein
MHHASCMSTVVPLQHQLHRCEHCQLRHCGSSRGRHPCPSWLPADRACNARLQGTEKLLQGLRQQGTVAPPSRMQVLMITALLKLAEALMAADALSCQGCTQVASTCATLAKGLKAVGAGGAVAPAGRWRHGAEAGGALMAY